MFERAAGLRVDGVLTQREVRIAQARRPARAAPPARFRCARRRRPRRRPRATTAAREPADRPGRPAAARSPRQVGGNGLAIAPAGAPAAVAAIIQAGNVIAHHPVPLRRRAPELAGHGLRLLGLRELRAARRGPARHAARLVRLLHLGRARPRPVGDDLRARTTTRTWSSRACATTRRRARAAARAGRAPARAPDGYVARHPAGL